MPSTTPASGCAKNGKLSLSPEAEAQEVMAIFEAYGITAQESAPVIAALRQRPTRWVDFMMGLELGLEKPDPKRALASALTIGGAYIVGGSIPLSPQTLGLTTLNDLVLSAPTAVSLSGLTATAGGSTLPVAFSAAGILGAAIGIMVVQLRKLTD